MSIFAFADETALRGGLPAGLAPPLLYSGKVGETKGLVADYTVALAEAMGRKAELSLITRYRLDGYLLKGQMDVLCYTSKAWASNQDALDFSKPLFTKREVILGPAPMPKKVSDLKGKTIGTILQYVYPKLDPLFESKQLKREDSPSEEANLKKLLHGRLSYVVTDELFIDYFKLENPKFEINRERLFMQEYPVVCSISRKGRVTEKELNAAIDKIKANGKLEAIFKKYGATSK
ncbi:substrate-binding periplasmic protein [Bdellovibrio sp. BCCA]|uniref:substrate-binding periplasmic protein n=1 Tax=Bdellovibrio sp. BCCA TaxID=3136281 RepID=UPI0030F0ED08